MKKILLAIMSVAALVGCGGPAADAVVEIKSDGKVEMPEGKFTKIFLAGSTDMSDSEDWQRDVVELFRHKGEGQYVIFNPRRNGSFSLDASSVEAQINWELESLEQSDVIIMNLPPESQSPISLLEIGLYARSGKLFVVCPDDFYRATNVQLTCARYGVEAYPSLNRLLKAMCKEGIISLR